MDMGKELSHIDKAGNPTMVAVSEKKATSRMAKARATVYLPDPVMEGLRTSGGREEITTKKGPVFHTAIIAGVMAAKNTGHLIPFCHPLGLDDCHIDISVSENNAIITCTCRLQAKTGVEMEALTGATVAALTVYDMCKALSHDISISEVVLLEKTGGKSDYKRV